MARPKTGRNGQPVKFYINPAVRAASDKVAFADGRSLSQWVENLMVRANRAASKKKARVAA